MIIAVLDSGFFPDRDVVLEAVNCLEPHFSLYRRDLRHPLDQGEWDQVLDEILDADRVVVV